MENKAGSFVAPTIESFQGAAANADWKNAPGLYMVLTDQPGKTSWPITGATFILMHKSQKNVSQAQAVLKWCAWSLENGQDEAVKLKYVPMPRSVVEMIKELWTQQMSGSNGQAVWTASSSPASSSR
jgi:phosphate transport system substrate-binding protein